MMTSATFRTLTRCWAVLDKLCANHVCVHSNAVKQGSHAHVPDEEEKLDRLIKSLALGMCRQKMAGPGFKCTQLSSRACAV